MKAKLFIIVFIGLSLIFTKANTQTVKNTVPVISYILPDDPIAACLNTLNSALASNEALWAYTRLFCIDIYTVPAERAECLILADDMNTALIQTDLNAFNRCAGY